MTGRREVFSVPRTTTTRTTRGMSIRTATSTTTTSTTTTASAPICLAEKISLLGFADSLGKGPRTDQPRKGAHLLARKGDLAVISSLESCSREDCPGGMAALFYESL